MKKMLATVLVCIMLILTVLYVSGVRGYGEKENQPPYQPTITCGPTAGGPRINLDFSAISPDPEGDQLYYMWDWGDGNFSDWLGSYTFGETITTRYSGIDDGEYEIRVKAKDTGEHESELSEPHLVSISKQIEIDNLKPGFVYFNIFIFDKPYAFISVLEPWGLSIVISNNGLFINAVAAEAVHSVKFTASRLPNDNQQLTVTDTDVSDDFNAYLDIPSGFYKTTAYAYDQNGNMIDSHTRDKVILIQLAS